jgi:hypothetical protein
MVCQLNHQQLGNQIGLVLSEQSGPFAFARNVYSVKEDVNHSFNNM